jgi:hypothetical protein
VKERRGRECEAERRDGYMGRDAEREAAYL